jgi:hypothetical protein
MGWSASRHMEDSRVDQRLCCANVKGWDKRGVQAPASAQLAVQLYHMHPVCATPPKNVQWTTMLASAKHHGKEQMAVGHEQQSCVLRCITEPHIVKGRIVDPPVSRLAGSILSYRTRPNGNCAGCACKLNNHSTMWQAGQAWWCRVGCSDPVAWELVFHPLSAVQPCARKSWVVGGVVCKQVSLLRLLPFSHL